MSQNNIDNQANKALDKTKDAGKTLGKGLKTLLKKIPLNIKLILALAFLVLVLIAGLWTWNNEERGTAARYSTDIDHDNIVMVDDNGVTRVVALSKEQAYIQSYYNYMSCQSYEKYVNGKKFSFAENTEDFAGLEDYYNRESVFYLLPEFIMMADELLNEEKFFYPEQVIKNVAYEIDENNNLITKDLLDEDGNIAVESYSYEEDMIAQSKTETEPGLWDYGLGSVIDYYPTAFTKDMYISCDYTHFFLTCQELIPSGNEDGEGTWVDAGTLRINIAGMGADAAIAHTRAMMDNYNDDTHRCFGPDLGALRALVSNKEHIPMKLEGEDVTVGRRQFKDSALNQFSNNTSMYPINVPLIRSVATFSGSLSYKYQQITTSAPLGDGTSADFSDSVNGIQLGSFIIYREGEIVTSLPDILEENETPIGYDYLDVYCDYYECFVPEDVAEDLNFTSRIEDDLGVKKLLQRLGLLKVYTGGTLEAIDGTVYSEDDLLRVAALIKHEAGANNRDRFMVGATFVNRWRSGKWGETTAEVLGAAGQYYNEDTDVTHKKFVEEAESNDWTPENNIFFYIADCCLSGKFAIPSNVYFQCAPKEMGQAAMNWVASCDVYLIINNTELSGFGYEHFYFTPSNDVCNEYDWADRPALAADDAIDLIESLTAAVVEETGGEISFDGEPVFSDNQSSVYMDPNKEYYQHNKFDVMKATRLQQKVADIEKDNWFIDIFGSMADKLSDFFYRVGSLFSINTGENSKKMLHSPVLPSGIEKEIVYQAVTFSSDELYSVVADFAPENDLGFLFVGNELRFNLGGDDDFNAYGVGTKIDGFISPTLVYYSPIQPWTQATGGVVLGPPSGTAVYSVADGGTVKEVEAVFNNGYMVTIAYAKDDSEIEVKFRYLQSVNVSKGQAVNKQTQIGYSGKTSDGVNALFFGLTINGESQNPMNFFYQASTDTLEILNKITAQYPGLSNERKEVITSALSAVGKIPYFWGGKPAKAEFNDNWGKSPATVYAGGNKNQPAGSRWLSGLDCSGFVQWVFWNVFNENCLSGAAGIQAGAANITSVARKINVTELLPGDTACQTNSADGAHVGIYLYSENGVRYYIHCSPGYGFSWTAPTNYAARGNVGVSNNFSFVYFGRPNCYSE